jgi:hypothetical protein
MTPNFLNEFGKFFNMLHGEYYDRIPRMLKIKYLDLIK